MNLLSNAKIFLEEIFPFLFSFIRIRRIRKKLEDKDLEKKLGSIDGPYARYHQLPDEELLDRIKEERERAKAMDEKTFKMTLSLSIGLTVLGSIADLLVKRISNEVLQILVAWSAGLVIVYSLLGGFMAIASLKTLPSYGYGTDFRLKLKNDRTQLVHDLVAQEIMNIIRHLRNESSYQCLRNAFIFLFFALVLYAANFPIEALKK